jgi:flagellar motor protein MotB
MLRGLTGVYRDRIRPRAKKIALGIVIFFALFTVLGFFVLPPILKYVLVKELSESLHRTVTIDRIAMNPYVLSVTVKGLTVRERTGPETFVSCDGIYLNLQSLSALRLAPMLKEARFTKPYVRIVRNRDLTYNFSDLLEGPSSKPTKFALNNISIENGSIDFLDEPKETKHTVRELVIGIPFISNIPSYVRRFVRPHFSARIDGALYTINGQTKPFTDTLDTSMNIDIKDLDLPFYMAYLPIKTKFKLASGSLDVNARIAFSQTKGKTPSLTVSGDVSVKKLAVRDEKNEQFFQLPLLQVSISPSEPLLQTIHLSAISIQSPELTIRRDKSGAINVLSLLPANEEIAPAPKKSEAPLPFSLDIDQIRLTGGKLSFSDLSVSKPFETVLSPTELSVDHFSLGKDKKSAYVLSTQTEAKETVKVQGQVSMDPLWTEGTVEVASVTLKKYSPYYSDEVLFSIEDGRLDLSSRYRYAAREKEPEINLLGLSLSLNSLRLRKAGDKGDFLKVPALSIKETDLDLTGRQLSIGSFSTQKGELFVKRLANGDVDLLKLIPPPSAAKEPPKKAPAVRKPVVPEKPWLVSLKEMLLDGYAVRVTDQTTHDPVNLTVQSLRVRGENISTAKNSKAKIAASLLLNGKGSLSASGVVGMDPLLANVKIGLKGVEIAPFQPYFTDKVRLTVTGGAFSTNGTVSLSSAKNGQMKVAYKGDASVANFASVDKAGGQDLLKLESLSLSDLGVNLAPLSIDVKGVSLTNFYALVSVSPEGKINLQEVLSPEEPKPEAAPPPGPSAQASPGDKEPPKDIKIDQVTLQAGKIDFVDNSVKPQFSTHLTEIGGRVSGLSAQQDTTADVDLRGKLNDYAPLEITGKINPLRDDLFVDLKARITDLDLSPATPYSGKYTGYTIEKGKLSLDVKYSIHGRKLDSQNDILIDQFNFGQKVESPDATKLPVRLAVALLKDRHGVIKLDLPVTGSLDDPKFSVWGVILKIIVNLVAKAATSPFALLGAVFGGGEELSYVEFDYGSASLTDQGMKKIATLSKALEDRPSLKLDMEGHVDMEKDRDALRQLLFQRKIKAQKLSEVTKKGQPVPPVDEVKIEPAEYEKYLKMAYKAEKFPKPKDFLGFAKTIPASEMEKLMLTHTEVTDGDLRALASQRAMNVRDVLVKSGHIDPERVFMVEPKLSAAEKKEKLKESRVDFTLK